MPKSGHATVSIGGRTRDAHIVIVEAVLGRALPTGVEVHHFDENPRNNAHENLVVCPDRAYHRLLHRRAAALAACGNPDWRKCNYCKQWDDPANLLIYTYPTCTATRHARCISAAQAGRKRSS